MPGLDEFGLDDDDDVDSLMLQHGLAGPAADGAAHAEQQLQQFSLEYARLRSEVVSAMSRETGTRGVFSPAEQALADLEAALQRIESLVAGRGPGDPWKLNVSTWRSDCESLERDIALRRAEREPPRPTLRPMPVVRPNVVPTAKKSAPQRDSFDLESPSREDSSNEVDHLLSSMRRPEPEEEHVQAPLTSLKLAAWDATFGIFVSPTAASFGEQRRPVKTIVLVCIVAALVLAGVLTTWREEFVDVIEDVPISEGLPRERSDVVDVVEEAPIGEAPTRDRQADVDFAEEAPNAGDDGDSEG